MSGYTHAWGREKCSICMQLMTFVRPTFDRSDAHHLHSNRLSRRVMAMISSLVDNCLGGREGLTIYLTGGMRFDRCLTAGVNLTAWAYLLSTHTSNAAKKRKVCLSFSPSFTLIPSTESHACRALPGRRPRHPLRLRADAAVRGAAGPPPGQGVHLWGAQGREPQLCAGRWVGGRCVGRKLEVHAWCVLP
jgi:hypothetical protein